MEFSKIDEPDSFTYRDLFCDENGTVNADMPVMEITVEFIEQDGGTLVRSSGVFDSQEGYDKVIAMGVVDGAAQTWQRLAELVETK
jgi:uncharacterized protein YndB with AHSA1/START domain